LRVVLDKPLHLFHQFKHLLRGETGHGFGDDLWSCLGWHSSTVEWGLVGNEEKEGGEREKEREDISPIVIKEEAIHSW
jgi:hypothetical protein